MTKLYFKEPNFPKKEFDFGDVITIEGLIATVNPNVHVIIDALLKAGNNVIVEDHYYTCTPIKEIYPDIETLKEYPKNFVTVKFCSQPWPG
jgi:hypothetical protein